MGMYDTINGEQVKCFYWTHYYNPEKREEGCHLTISGGNLYYFDNGDKVPYKNSAYNYTKNFVILDGHFRSNTHRCLSCGYESYDKEEICPECGKELKKCPAITHIIRDGKVKETIYLLEEDKETYFNSSDMYDRIFKGNNKVISYYGDEMNIHSMQDIFQYLENLKIYSDYVTNSFKDTNLIRIAIQEERKKKENGTFSEEKYKKLVEDYGKAVDAKNEKIEEVKKKYINQYYIPNEIAETFGQYLEVLYEYAGLEDKEEVYKLTRKEFLSFYTEKYLEEYFLYMNFSEQEKEDIKILIEQYKKEEG